MKHFLLALSVLVSATMVSVNAVSYLPPKNSVYKSMDLPGGTMLTGHFSESWIGPGGHGQINNTINEASWDGATLGTEWMLWCTSVVASPALVSDTRDANGTGEVTWRITFDGGRFWLTKDGPWSSDHEVDFTGDVVEFIMTTTYQYVLGDLLVIRSSVTSTGHFDMLEPFWDWTCMAYEINTAVFFGNTDEDGPVPPEFPMLLDPNACPAMVLPSPERGAWGDVTHIALQIINCGIDIEEVTWGAIKLLYK